MDVSLTGRTQSALWLLNSLACDILKGKVEILESSVEVEMLEHPLMPEEMAVRYTPGKHWLTIVYRKFDASVG